MARLDLDRSNSHLLNHRDHSHDGRLVVAYDGYSRVCFHAWMARVTGKVLLVTVSLSHEFS